MPALPCHLASFIDQRRNLFELRLKVAERDRLSMTAAVTLTMDTAEDVADLHRIIEASHVATAAASERDRVMRNWEHEVADSVVLAALIADGRVWTG